MKIQIVIAQRGWVFVGMVHEVDGKIVITGAKNIRRWGTDKGLGQLAAEGPLINTKLDEMGTVSLHPLSVVASIDCEPSKWPI